MPTHANTSFNTTQKRQLLLSLGWLVLAGAFGLLLRWHFVQPISDFPFAWWRHAHSHLAFLGWIGNALLSLLLFNQLLPGFFKKLWWFSQLLILGMAISFPLSGYSAISIVFSTTHIVCCWLFAGWWFFRGRINAEGVVRSATDWAMGLMSVSQLGPIGLGLSMAIAPENNVLYSFFLHFYLYFQHSGWFIMGALAAWLNYHRSAPTDQKWQALVRWTGYYLLLYFSAAYVQADFKLIKVVLSLFSIGFAIQLLRLLPFFWHQIRSAVPTVGLQILADLVVFSLGLKLLLEAIFLLPWVADQVLPNRFLMLGFLHLNFLGISSPFLLLLLFRSIPIRTHFWPVILYVFGSVPTLLLLFSISFIASLSIDAAHVALFLAAVFIWFGQVLFGLLAGRAWLGIAGITFKNSAH